MRVGIINRERDAALDCGILGLLPPPLAAEIGNVPLSRIDEIRLRRDGICTLVSDGENLPLKNRIDGAGMGAVLQKLCDGSLYAHGNTINRGYVVFRDGVRVGVCGRAVTEGGRVVGVYDISSICVRLPHRVPPLGGHVCDLLRKSRGGILVFSPPGVGKTTLLRAVIAEMTQGRDALRCSVVDTRGELACFLPQDTCADILSGYPKGEGIDIAARCFNPQLIVCDEIGGDPAEAQAIAAAHNCGVPLLATAHAARASELLRRDPIAILHKKGIFSYYVGISRGGDGSDYLYETVSADEL